MELFRLKDAPISMKLFTSLILCVVGFGYLTLLGTIWIDTEMKISLIIEGYGSLEFIELVAHSFQYIFWFIGTFTIVVSIFLLTSYPDKIKRIFSVLVPLFIVSDIGSMWLIRYLSLFAWQLYASGLVLAVCFLTMFSLIQYDLWLKKG